MAQNLTRRTVLKAGAALAAATAAPTIAAAQDIEETGRFKPSGLLVEAMHKKVETEGFSFIDDKDAAQKRLRNQDGSDIHRKAFVNALRDLIPEKNWKEWLTSRADQIAGTDTGDAKQPFEALLEKEIEQPGSFAAYLTGDRSFEADDNFGPSVDVRGILEKVYEDNPEQDPLIAKMLEERDTMETRISVLEENSERTSEENRELRDLKRDRLNDRLVGRHIEAAGKSALAGFDLFVNKDLIPALEAFRQDGDINKLFDSLTETRDQASLEREGAPAPTPIPA